MTYDVYLFKKDRDDTAYYLKMDITGGIYGVETGVLDGKAVSAAVCAGCKLCIVNSRRYVRQTVRGINEKSRYFD